MGLKKSGDDAEVVRSVLDGNVDDYAILVERYRDEFGRYAASLCGDGDLAADAMQEALLRAFRSLASCRDPARFKAWFFRILTNQCHNARDRQRSHVAIEDVVVAAEDGADDALRGEEIRRAIDTALEDLTPAQREAFVLKHVEGYSYVEIAEMLGDGVDALKMRVHRAREVVKERLKHLR